MSNIVTIAEEFTLPSKGLIYDQRFDPTIELRSMTVAEEMKRLTYTERPFKLMSDIIEDCLLTKLPVHVYDMCLGDYEYLLHKLRIITYGSDYKIPFICPKCGEVTENEYDLNNLKISELSMDDKINFNLILPDSHKNIKLKFHTPRDIDNITLRSSKLKKEFPEMEADPIYMLTLESMIDLVDNEKMNQAFLENWIKKLSMKDANVILQSANKLNEKVGIDTNITLHCDKCNNDVKTTFRITDEFFRPQVY